MLENSLENKTFWNNFAWCKILVKQDIFTCAKLFQNILFSKPFFNMQNLNKIKYFTPGKMHRKTYSFTSLILHPSKITWPQECLHNANIHPKSIAKVNYLYHILHPFVKCDTNCL